MQLKAAISIIHKGKFGKNPEGFDLQGEIKLHGFTIKVENRKGSVRSGTDPDGHEWKIKMKYPYGYIGRTKGADDEHVDCYVGDNRKSEKIFVVHQNDPSTGEYDEDKVMFGFDSAKEAKKAYQDHYDSKKFFGSMTEMTLDEFRSSLRKNKASKLIKSIFPEALDVIEEILKGRKPDPIGTVRNGRKKVADGKWVKVKDGAAKKKSDVYPPFDDKGKFPKGYGLGIEKKDLPQIRSEDRPAFYKRMQEKYGKDVMRSLAMDSRKLKPAQNAINLTKLEHMVKHMEGKATLIASNDNHIIDGHHRWAAKYVRNEKIDVVQFQRTAKQLIKDMFDEPKVERDTIDTLRLNKAVELMNSLLKGRKADPVGTVRNGRKKVADGKWVDVKEGQSKKIGAIGISNSNKVEELVDRVNKISQDKNMDATEKKVKIAEVLSGTYSNGTDANRIEVYRSPSNRTLLAVRGNVNGEKIHKVDLTPDKILSAVERIQKMPKSSGHKTSVAKLSKRGSHIASTLKQMNLKDTDNVELRSEKRDGKGDGYLIGVYKDGQRLGDLGSHPSENGAKALAEDPDPEDTALINRLKKSVEVIDKVLQR